MFQAEFLMDEKFATIVQINFFNNKFLGQHLLRTEGAFLFT